MRRIALIAVVIGTIAVPARLSFAAGQPRPTADCAACQDYADRIIALEQRYTVVQADGKQTSAELASLRTSLASLQARLAQLRRANPSTATASQIEVLTAQIAAEQAAVDAQAARLKEIVSELTAIRVEIATWTLELVDCNRRCPKPKLGDWPTLPNEPCPACETLSAALVELEAHRAAILRSLDAYDSSLGLSAAGAGRPVADFTGGSRDARVRALEGLDGEIAKTKEAIEKCRLTCKGSKRYFFTRPGIVLPITGVLIGGVLVNIAGDGDGSSPASTATTPTTVTQPADFTLVVGTGEFHEGPSEACVSLTPIPRQPGAAYSIQAMGASVRPGQNLTGTLDQSGAAVVRIGISQTGPITVVATVTSATGVQRTVTTTFTVTGTNKPCSAGQ
jgi:hypothetical protein